MKLILTGGTGLVGTEIILQSVKNPKITSIIALSRRPVTAPKNAGEGADVSKLKSIVLEDFTNYPDDVKAQLADADACIWCLAITPLKSRSHKQEEVVRVNQEYPIAGLKAIAEARGSRSNPFRFLYVSGDMVPRDMSQKPAFLGLGDYLLMRGETENQVLAFAAEHKDAGFEACVAKPGLIGSPGTSIKNYLLEAASWVGVRKVGISECAAAMIDQVINGFEKDPLDNADLVRLGRKALEGGGKA